MNTSTLPKLPKLPVLLELKVVYEAYKDLFTYEELMLHTKTFSGFVNYVYSRIPAGDLLDIRATKRKLVSVLWYDLCKKRGLSAMLYARRVNIPTVNYFELQPERLKAYPLQEAASKVAHHEREIKHCKEQLARHEEALLEAELVREKAEVLQVDLDSALAKYMAALGSSV